MGTIVILAIVFEMIHSRWRRSPINLADAYGKEICRDTIHRVDFRLRRYGCPDPFRGVWLCLFELK